jgi:hypothetical protein
MRKREGNWGFGSTREQTPEPLAHSMTHLWQERSCQGTDTKGKMTERVACQASTCLYRSGAVNQPIVWSSHNAFVKSKIKKKSNQSWAWWYMPVISVLGKLRQEDCEFQANLNYIVKSCLTPRPQKKSSQNDLNNIKKKKKVPRVVSARSFLHRSTWPSGTCDIRRTYLFLVLYLS